MTPILAPVIVALVVIFTLLLMGYLFWLQYQAAAESERGDVQRQPLSESHLLNKPRPSGYRRR